MLGFLLASAIAASAQGAAPGAMPAPPTPPAPPVAAAPRASAGLPPSIEVPTLRVEQIADPVRWRYHLAEGGGADLALANRKGPVAYLGVSASPPPRELAPHLPIDEDTGLVIEFLTKGSPAEKAGLQEQDVLAKLDDQILIHPRQLAILVANHKEGDNVKIIYVRKGQLQETTAVLGKQESITGEISEARFHSRDADVLIEGDPTRPLKTFIRRLQTAPGAAGVTEEIRGLSGAGGVVGIVPPPVKDVQAELQEIRKMLEDLGKQLEAEK